MIFRGGDRGEAVLLMMMMDVNLVVIYLNILNYILDVFKFQDSSRCRVAAKEERQTLKEEEDGKLKPVTCLYTLLNILF